MSYTRKLNYQKGKKLNYKIETIPCLSDNYAFVIIEHSEKKAILVDAPEANPIINFLETNLLSLDYILLTHHHDDHIQGVKDLVTKYGSKVIGASDDEYRLPELDMHVKSEDNLQIAGLNFKILDVPGHTVGHIAFYCEELESLFSGDSLMVMGCGRLFEGTPEQMWNSLSKLKKLDPSTMIYSGHEYTEANARFCQTIEKNNEDLKSRLQEIKRLRSSNIPTIPSKLSQELLTNTFIRADNDSVKKDLELDGCSALEVFTEIRRRKDSF